MPVNVKRFCSSIFYTSLFAAAASAQTTQPSPATPKPVPSPQIVAIKAAPTSAEIMRERISKAKAYIAVRNYNAAIYELENIRRETSDSSVNAVVNVLLMNSYLEQGDHKRAQEFLSELYTQQKTGRSNGPYYNAVAAQVVKSSRNQLERYRALGLTVSDRNLPLEALNDIERTRETLEIVITQAKEMSADKTKSAAAMSMLEEATNSRSALARDEYDARRWRDAVSDSREQLANSQSVITSAVDGTVTSGAARPATTGANVPSVTQPSAAAQPLDAAPTFRPVSDSSPRPTENQASSAQQPVRQPNVSPSPQPIVRQPNVAVAPADSRLSARVVPEPATPASTPVSTPTTAGKTEALEVGSLIAYATQQAAPVYPATARMMRASGVVKVELTVDENGSVASVGKASGHSLLQSPAKDAVRKWKFKPFTRDGQPVKATGFVNFNFSL